MIFGHYYLISEPIFKLFMALFRTHELQKDGMVIFFLWCFRKVRFRKMQFLKDGVQTVGSETIQNTKIKYFMYYSSLGRKAGKGVYVYEQGKAKSKSREENKDALRLLEKYRLEPKPE